MLVYILTLALISGGLGEPAEVVLEYQDSLGQYSFGYSAPESARSEVRSADGSTRGAFSYIDGAGVIQTAKYTADSENGFRIEASNLPQAPMSVQETPEVQAARLEHFRAYEAARNNAENEHRQQNEQGNEIMQKLVKSSSQQNTNNAMQEQRTSLKQLSHQNEMEEVTPALKTYFILPGNVLSVPTLLTQRQPAKTSNLSSSTFTKSIPQGDMMNKVKKDESKSTQISQTQLHQLYSSPSIVSSSYRIPVYSYHQRLQFIPSY